MQNIKYLSFIGNRIKETRELRGVNIENGPLVPGPDEQTERARTMMRVGPELREREPRQRAQTAATVPNRLSQ